MNSTKVTPSSQVVLVGAGIMSATLGILLKELEPSIKITIFERLDMVAGESSNAWNNAGTGHAAYCELNYTPELEDGTIEVKKAIKIASAYEMSKAFWAYLVKEDYFKAPESFINNIPHISFVWGEDNVSFLKKRYEALRKYALFEGIQYSEDPEVLRSWMPLVIQERDKGQKIAATKLDLGTDVNFGNLTQVLIDHLATLEGVQIKLSHEVRDLEKERDGSWEIKYKDLEADETFKMKADFVFLGAGGGSLSLLDKSDIDEGRGYGGFPISGQFLVCNKEALVAQHHAKVYGKASVGAPPMSVPHLDTRLIDGKKTLLFGPFAGFSTKFLKNGSYFDLPFSIELDNFMPMISAGLDNWSLTKYLIHQVSLSQEDRLEALKEYLPSARLEDWELCTAGQRVQVIKKDRNKGGVLEFGTEIVSAADGSIAALLGASPGASTSVSSMIDVLKKCFPENMNSDAWQQKLNQMIPCYGEDLVANETLCKEIRLFSAQVLHLLD
jgi:malate dehydrogenase (quinone)